MSRGGRGRYRKKRQLTAGYIRKKTCEECRKYSRKTFYCAKWRKVVDQKSKVCMYFTHRRGARGRGGRTRGARLGAR